MLGPKVQTLRSPQMTDLYVPGMREEWPDLCWRLIDDGDRACIQERGHHDGIHEGTHHLTGVELLADEINQFAMAVEEFAYRSQVSANARLADSERERYRILFTAARTMRQRIAELIPS